jgi:hypothetical protein
MGRQAPGLASFLWADEFSAAALLFHASIIFLKLDLDPDNLVIKKDPM